ncbi:MAG: SDR family NAD(P)-dependent oxidoreductase [Prolixibacteraceae bacterium]|nr:SDR family NAD(P)-dependent oxidoreductase [Prolixibacteraceae bacterium]
MENETTRFYTLITGASAGLGKQIAIECAKRGHNLFLVSLPKTGLEELVEDLKSNYAVSIEYLSIDLTKKKAPQKVYDFALGKGLAVNILVNNAGLGFNGKLENQTYELIDTMVLLNVRAATLLTFLFLPSMKIMTNAYVLNISSFGALTPLPNKSVYAATKTYLLFLTQALNEELKGTNVKVTSVHPNGIRSERANSNINKSGLIARIASLSPEYVATIALDNMLAGNKFVIPGAMSKFYYYLGISLPHGIILKIVGLIFRKTS